MGLICPRCTTNHLCSPARSIRLSFSWPSHSLEPSLPLPPNFPFFCTGRTAVASVRAAAPPPGPGCDVAAPGAAPPLSPDGDAAPRGAAPLPCLGGDAAPPGATPPPCLSADGYNPSVADDGGWVRGLDGGRIHRDKTRPADPAEVTHLDEVRADISGEVESVIAQLSDCSGSTGWAIGPSCAGDQLLAASSTWFVFWLVGFVPGGTRGKAHLAVLAGKTFSESGCAAGFKEMRSGYTTVLARDGWKGLTADLTPGSVTLLRLWTLPDEVAFKSVMWQYWAPRRGQDAPHGIGRQLV